MPDVDPSPRQRVVWAYKSLCADQGKAPTLEAIQDQVPGTSPTLIQSTVRLIRIIEASKARSVVGLRKWQDEHAESDPTVRPDPELLKNFSTDAAHETIKAWLVTPGEPVREVEVDPPQESEEERGSERAGAGARSGELPHALARPELIDLWRQWQETADNERRKAAEQARADERRIAEAQLAAERDRATTLIAAERERTVAQTALQRANGRTVLFAVTLVAVIAGVCGGRWWALSVPARSHEEGGQVVPPTPLPPGVVTPVIPTVPASPLTEVPTAHPPAPPAPSADSEPKDPPSTTP